MNIYSKKQRWKLLLLAAAILIVGLSLWYTNTLVKNISKEERNKAILWAEAIQRKASMVKYTEQFFDKLKAEEKKKVEIWAEATKRLICANYTEDLTFYSDIIAGNTTIPVILTDENNNITSVVNVDDSIKKYKKLEGKLKEDFTRQKPIIVRYGDKKNILYYKESKILTELRNMMQDLINSFISEVVLNTASVPVIITDSTKTKIIDFGNINPYKLKDSISISKMISSMSESNKPITIDLPNNRKNYIFYENSSLLTRLKYYPYIQFLIIGLFLLIAYLAFSATRKAEQDNVWLGMAKETAHQLGTPLTSLMGWVEFLKLKGLDESSGKEIEKDIERLRSITERFSKIGSTPSLEKVNIVEVIENSVEYIKTRTSEKVKFRIINTSKEELYVPLNVPLFEWVIENLCKNSIDAMNGCGAIHITICNELKHIYIDISDSGKGIHKSKFKTIFNPGFTSKQRGWGLGLTLAQRIVEKYHSGKIYVKSSTLNKGTTFRIILRK
ncbi:MAG: HAMP domain-containing sensor histidine kinase [Bacteroidota bacterium]|nr:HAMP domain-containing sensor histidine kinase [Bacteroidota bacterium]